MNAEFKTKGKIIETARLILRPFRSADLDNLYEYVSVKGVGEMAGWKHHESKEETRRVLDVFMSEDKVFAICFKENNKVIVSLGVEKYGREEDLAEFDGYRDIEIMLYYEKKEIVKLGELTPKWWI